MFTFKPLQFITSRGKGNCFYHHCISNSEGECNVNFLDNSLHSAVLWICDENSTENKTIF